MIAGRKLVFGVGLNDAGYRICDTHQKDGRQVNTWVCPIYQTWAHMLRRCYSELAQRSSKNSSYIGCSVDTEWHKFSAFRSWALTQPWQGNQLDKDLLLVGNKTYRQDLCLFIPQALNTFVTDCASSRGEWPLGVSRVKRTGKFVANCRNPFTDKYDHLGCFLDPLSAHRAWRQRKHQHACRYAEVQTDPRIAEALRNRYIEHKDYSNAAN